MGAPPSPRARLARVADACMWCGCIVIVTYNHMSTQLRECMNQKSFGAVAGGVLPSLSGLIKRKSPLMRRSGAEPRANGTGRAVTNTARSAMADR